ISSLLKVLVAVAVGLPLIVYLAQDALIFYRQPLPEARRADLARRFPSAQEVFLQAKDGTRLHAWHVRAGAPLVIYFGGNAEGVSWLLVDYRGYGLSEGAPGEAALVSDALQWFDHAMTFPGADPKQTFAFG